MLPYWSIELKTKQEESIILKMQNNNQLQIKHTNAIFNCCIEQLYVETSLLGDTIIINEKESETDYTCNCICPYDLEYSIINVPFKDYIIKLQKMNADYVQFNLNINSETETIIIID